MNSKKFGVSGLILKFFWFFCEGCVVKLFMTSRLAFVKEIVKHRLLIIDGHSLAFRAFYGLPVENFSTAKGQSTNAVYGFISMFISLLKEQQPTHAVVAFDLHGPTFRVKEYPEYKAGRSKTPEEFFGQIELIQEVLVAMNVVFVTFEGYEADDIIATLASLADAADYEVLISSGDRDVFQLINDNVAILYPKRGVSNLVRLEQQQIIDKYAVTPKQYPDLAALVGEKADNLPGVPKVGEKTAAKWLALYGSLENIFANAANIKGVVGENLRSHIGQVQRNRRLNRLVTDLQLGFSLEDFCLFGYDREAIESVFLKLEFSDTLKKRLLALGENEVSVSFSSPVLLDYCTVSTANFVAWLADKTSAVVLEERVLGVSWVSGVVDGLEEVVALALVSKSSDAFYVCLDELDVVAQKALFAWLIDEQKPKVVYDSKSFFKVFMLKNLDVVGVVDDILLSAYLLEPDRRNYSLEELSRQYLRSVFWEDKQDGLSELEVQQRCVQEAVVLLQLREVFLVDLQQFGGQQLAAVVELPVAKVLSCMERFGVAVDKVSLFEMLQNFQAKSELAKHLAYEQLGYEVNLGSPKQLQKVLFEDLCMPKTKKIKTGYSTDAQALRDLLVRKPHPFLVHLLEYRDFIKLCQILDGLLKAAQVDGRVHTSYQQTVASTGRLSSVNPNLQNIPIRTSQGASIRGLFVPGADYEMLLTADYSQIEMRVMAHLCEDPALIAAFVAKEDLHSYVGSHIFGVEPSAVTSDMRAKVKAVSYGLVYGLSSFGLSKQLGISVDEARMLMKDYFDRFGAVRQYLQSVVQKARDLGYTETIMGRRRYLPNLNSDVHRLREVAERAALNSPIQGSAADIIKLAMLGVSQRLLEEDLRSRLLLQVHDELVLEIFSGEVEVVEGIVREEMTSAVDLLVPLDVNIGFGKNWLLAGH